VHKVKTVDAVDQYDAMDACEETVDAVQWWSQVPKSMDQLRLLAECYLHTPCSSVASEEEFSHAGLQVSPRRNRLDPTTVETIMTVSRNSHMLPDFAAAATESEQRKAKRAKANKQAAINNVSAASAASVPPMAAPVASQSQSQSQSQSLPQAKLSANLPHKKSEKTEGEQKRDRIDSSDSDDDVLLLMKKQKTAGDQKKQEKVNEKEARGRIVDETTRKNKKRSNAELFADEAPAATE
jgi:hypothetical protein